jgi:quinol monooxygenase YgiN
MAVVVIATLRPLPDRRDEVIAVMHDVIARVHAEDEGCLLYALHEAPDRLVMVEKWSSPEALAAHGRGAAIAELGKRLDGLVEGGSDLQILQPHPAGTADQGAL